MSGAYWLTRTCGCGRAILVHREWCGLDYRATYYDGQQAGDQAPITRNLPSPPEL